MDELWHEISETRDYTTLTIRVPRGEEIKWSGIFKARGEIIIRNNLFPVRLRFNPTKELRVIIVPEDVEADKTPLRPHRYPNDTPIDSTDLSVRAKNCLANTVMAGGPGLKTIGELLEFCPLTGRCPWRGVGRTTIREINSKLREWGYLPHEKEPDNGRGPVTS